MYSWQHILIRGATLQGQYQHCGPTGQTEGERTKQNRRRRRGGGEEGTKKKRIYINTRLLNDQVDCLAGCNFFSNGLVYGGDEECETLVVFDNGASVPSRVHTPCFYSFLFFCFFSLFVLLLSFFFLVWLYKYIKGDTGECGLST